MAVIIGIIYRVLFFYLGNKYFPEYVICQDTKSIILAILFQIVFSILLFLIFLGLYCIIMALKENNLMLAIILAIIAIIIYLGSDILELIYTQIWIKTIKINGIIPYIVYTLGDRLLSFPSIVNINIKK